MRTWLADRETYCPFCRDWVAPDAAWEIDPAFIFRDDTSLDAIVSGELRHYAVKIPEDRRRWEIKHWPDQYRLHSFVGTLREVPA